MIQKKGWIFLLFACYLAAAWYLLMTAANFSSSKTIDLASMNRLVNEAANKWEAQQQKQAFELESPCPYGYALLDLDGTLLYQSQDGLSMTVHDAIRKGEAVMDVEKDGVILGRMIFQTDMTGQIDKIRRRFLIAGAQFCMLLLLPAVLGLLYLYRAVLHPFQDLKDFTRHIAMGNLDAPLPMDHSHVFGAFTESFDLMREQLKEARIQEAQANQSKKELTASLSHDIKTPVASIRVIAELLFVTTKEEATRQKLGVILQKSEQISRLVTNMLSASLEDLGEMNIKSSEESSLTLEPIIRHSDYLGKVRLSPIPGCILSFDRLRIEQVIDNIINNSYKYAGTPIDVTCQLESGGLLIEFADHGSGVSQEELPFLFHKYYRGSARQSDTEGSGLGLFICRGLMERMGGAIECQNRDGGGFIVTLFLPFAGA